MEQDNDFKQKNISEIKPVLIFQNNKEIFRINPDFYELETIEKLEWISLIQQFIDKRFQETQVEEVVINDRSK